MDPLALLLLVVVAAIVFDFTNGWNDSANAIATVVSTRVLPPGLAVLWSAIVNFVGALVSTKVALTIGAGVVTLPVARESQIVVLCAMVSAAAWVAWCTRLGLPISASHALIGGLTGSAVGLYGFEALQWDGIVKILVALVASPVFGLIVAFVFLVLLYTSAVGFRSGGVRKATGALAAILVLIGAIAIVSLIASGAIAWGDVTSWLRSRVHSALWVFVLPVVTLAFVLVFLLRGMTQWSARKAFGPLQLCSSTFMAFEHGKNDAQKVMGVIALSLFVGGFLTDSEGRVITDISGMYVPLWVKMACGGAIALGTAVGGWKVIRTLGTKLAHINPADGFVAETTAGIVLETAAELGVPVSTTHTITGAILGVGSAKRFTSVKWALGAKIVYAWVFTLPVCFVVGVGFILVAKTLGPLVLVTGAVLTTILVYYLGVQRQRRAALIAVSITEKEQHASEVEPDLSGGSGPVVVHRTGDRG